MVSAIGLGGAAAVYLLLHRSITPVHALLTFMALSAMGAALALLLRRSTPLAAIVFLSTGAAAIVAVTDSTTDVPSGWFVPAVSVVHLVGIAVVMVGGVSLTRMSGIMWTATAAVVVAGADLLAAFLLGISPVAPWMAWCAAGLVITIYAVTGSSRVRRVRLAQPDIHRAARDEKLAEVRSGVERRAAALLHDTVLGSLASIAHGPVGALSPALARAIDRDLDAILGRDWTESIAVEDEPAVDRVLACVIAEVEETGLAVVRAGDVAALERLDPRRAHELALAVKQVLVNVQRHSGVLSAELIVIGYPESVTVMIVDAGVGFDPTDIDADRIGLRTSVIDRIERVGGSVRLWSTLGKGTSVLISLPVEHESASVDARPRASVDGRVSASSGVGAAGLLEPRGEAR